MNQKNSAQMERQRWQRAVEILRTQGLKSLWFAILGETVYRRVVIMARALDQPVTQGPPRVPVDIRRLADTEIDDYLQFRPEADSAEVRRRMTSGHICFVARHEGHIVHAGWDAFGRVWIAYLARDLQLAPDEVYAYDAYTVPSFRGHNIAAARAAQEAHYFRTAGYRRRIAVVMPENLGGWGLTTSAGHRPIGVMGYVKLGPWRWDFCRMYSRARSLGRTLVTDGPTRQ